MASPLHEFCDNGDRLWIIREDYGCILYADRSIACTFHLHVNGTTAGAVDIGHLTLLTIGPQILNGEVSRFHSCFDYRRRIVSAVYCVRSAFAVVEQHSQLLWLNRLRSGVDLAVPEHFAGALEDQLCATRFLTADVHRHMKLTVRQFLAIGIENREGASLPVVRLISALDLIQRLGDCWSFRTEIQLDGDHYRFRHVHCYQLCCRRRR